MTDKEKLEAVLNLLTDQNVGRLVKAGQIEGEQEEFGALVALGNTFKRAYRIYQTR